MQDKRRLLFDKQVDQAAQYSCGAIDTGIGNLTEKEWQEVRISSRLY